MSSIISPTREGYSANYSGKAAEDNSGAKMGAQAFRLRPIMKQGTAASIPETWTHYSSIEDARAGARLMYQNDRVLRVMVVTDSVGSFVEWIER